MKNIKKIISIVVLTLFVKSLSAQVGQARTLIVNDGDMENSLLVFLRKHKCIITLKDQILIILFKY